MVGLVDIGFELEFCSEYNKSDLKLDLARLFEPFNYISESKRGRCSVKNYPKNSFSIYKDKTIDADYANQNEFELVTPVWNIKDGKRNLYKLLNWLYEIGVTTNKTTGLHFSLSEKNKLYQRPVWKQIVELTNEKKWLKKFNRLDNAFVRPHKGKILRHDGARAISFRRKRYVEFRIPGGKNYHLKQDLIWETIEHCQGVLNKLNH